MMGIDVFLPLAICAPFLVALGYWWGQRAMRKELDYHRRVASIFHQKLLACQANQDAADWWKDVE